ncbi:ATP-binding protein [Diatrype stigma]|uniref:ATP-binding protein n=1 Tax=Diatrype stigma TaxID=117547 RepID=A0AAN9YSS2_9PEZI
MWLMRARRRTTPCLNLSLNLTGRGCYRRTFASTVTLRTAPRRTSDFNSGFTSSYDPANEEGRGPMFSKASFGVPQFYPRDLKRRVDEYVVGQDRAKKIISSVLFNHYQGLRRRQYQEEQERKREEKLLRQALARERHARERDAHPLDAEDDFPGHYEDIQHMHQSWHQSDEVDFYRPDDESRPVPIKIDKSNLLLIGPTGVGKTYILETLSKTINVPFTISDCNSFTQAGYIGQDVETCIERLLIEANYDVRAAEHGIVVLDEFDKIAKRETMNGRDVGGEGVQQALLKLIEGTKVTVNVKDTRSSSSPSSSRSASPITTNYTGSSSTSAPQQPPPSPPPGTGGLGGMGGGGGAKVDQYTIDTSNILFVMCGAFVGLDKTILNRVAKPTMGFGSEIRSRGSSAHGSNDPDLPPELFAHLPHHSPAIHPDPISHSTSTPTPTSTGPYGASSPSPSPSSTSTPNTNKTTTTPLDLATPTDLQAFGFIPELIGRIHTITALAPLSHSDLLRVLTEPRNSLLAQYTALFETYPSRLRFTRKALAAIARRAAQSKTGARALRMEVERVLAEAVFDAPTPHVLVTEAAVEGREKVGYWGRGGAAEVERRVREEDGEDGEDLSLSEHEREKGGGEGREILSGGGDYRGAGQAAF